MENKLTKRFVDTRAQKAILKKKFVVDSVCDKYFDADISLLEMVETKTKWDVTRDDGRTECILDSGYKWLGVYPKGESYAITGLYNKNNELVEFYFDMTKENGMENGIPYIVDIYLDLVITPNNEKYILDEDELEEALNDKILGKVEFDLAYETLHRLEKKYNLQENVDELALVMNKYLENMKDKIKNAEIIVKEDIL